MIEIWRRSTQISAVSAKRLPRGPPRPPQPSHLAAYAMLTVHCVHSTGGSQPLLACPRSPQHMARHGWCEFARRSPLPHLAEGKGGGAPGGGGAFRAAGGCGRALAIGIGSPGGGGGAPCGGGGGGVNAWHKLPMPKRCMPALSRSSETRTHTFSPRSPTPCSSVRSSFPSGVRSASGTWEEEACGPGAAGVSAGAAGNTGGRRVRCRAVACCAMCARWYASLLSMSCSVASTESSSRSWRCTASLTRLPALTMC
mmetsp:Transcript_21751/g.70253  ORF Transcript_21751/g.70253 Transcript_21751/m.70253 type:complete len:255 (-) Transcript_21751:257-1021(-)